MASFRKERANYGLGEKENGQLWPLLEKSQLWAKRERKWATMASFREERANCGIRKKRMDNYGLF
jgi:hypothetical protein